ncbi:helicase DnaB [Paenibacillus sp.]|jgi:replication initiation and membrane attachment protein|uniref:helicase DnaB n=1 Tax=Paenibacillus sp. TaxID=58172 RepID=UPI0028192CB1|nr:helicase DnaB [Paenibacillus sp.]MDR0268280.1 DnaD domain protein [Paenibacillus sp.]
MHLKSLLHFTENHRYCVYRDFCLSSLDSKMLSSVYQPMVGAFAISLYHLLFQQIPIEKLGYSSLEQQRRLFLTLGLEPSEKGRRFLIEQASLLEAVGLLQTCRMYMPEHEDYVYEYELQQPLSPAEFFNTQHLTLLLRDKIGKFAVLALREELWAREPEEFAVSPGGHKENISLAFYDIFELNTHVIDYELEQALSEVSTTRQHGVRTSADDNALNYADIILRFPKDSVNRAHVEKLRFNHEQMGIINYVVNKYDLSVQDLCRLLDEDGVFAADGGVNLDELQRKANLHFRQDKRRQEQREVYAGKVVSFHQSEESADPAPQEHAVEMEFYVDVPVQFQSKCDVHQYNMMLRNEPYTRLLKTFFPGSVPDNFFDIFDKIDHSYKLPGEVINVLIHYLMSLLTSGGNEQRINRNFVEAIASNMLLKQVNTYEKAVQYIRDQAKVKGKQAAASGGGRTRTYGNKSARLKPEIPIAQENHAMDTVSEEEFEEMLRMAAEMQASKKKGI